MSQGIVKKKRTIPCNQRSLTANCDIKRDRQLHRSEEKKVKETPVKPRSPQDDCVHAEASHGSGGGKGETGFIKRVQPSHYTNKCPHMHTQSPGRRGKKPIQNRCPVLPRMSH